MSGSSSIPRKNSMAQPSSSVTVSTDALTTTSATSTASSSSSGDTRVVAGNPSRHLAGLRGSSFSSTGGVSDPDVRDRLARRRPAQSVIGVAGATSLRKSSFRSNPNADTQSLTSGESENLNPPGHGGHPYATSYNPIDDNPGAPTHESKSEREFKGELPDLSPDVQDFFNETPTGHKGLRPRDPEAPGKDRFGDHLSTTSSSSSSNPAHASKPTGSPRSQAYDQRILMQQKRQQALEGDARSTTSSGQSVPGSGQGSSSFSATSAHSTSQTTASVHTTASGPVRPRDDFRWGEREDSALGEFERWLQIPAARDAIDKHLGDGLAPEIVQFLRLCDEVVKAQRVDSDHANRIGPSPGRTSNTYDAIRKLLDNCFNEIDEEKRKLLVNCGSEQTSALKEAFAKLMPDHDLTWSSDMLRLIKHTRSTVLLQAVTPMLTPELKTKLTAAADENARRLADADTAHARPRRPTFKGVLFGPKKPPKPDPAP